MDHLIPSRDNPVSRRRTLALLAMGGSALLAAACGGGTTSATQSSAGTQAAPTPSGAATQATGVSQASTAAAATTTTAVAKPAAVPTSSLPPQSPPKQGQTVVTMMTRGDDYIFKLFRTQYAEFAKTNPTIYLKFDDSPGDYYQKLQLQVASGTPPDLLFECDCSLGSSYRAKIVEAVDPYLAKEKDFSEDAFDKNAWFAETYAGKRWGLPWDSGACAIYFNVDMFNAAQIPLPDPQQRWTWNQLLDAARKLTVDLDGKKAGDAGFNPARVKVFGFNTNTTWGLMRFVFGGGGEPLQGDPGTPPANHQVTLDTAEATDGLQWLADLVSKYHVMPDPSVTQATPISFASKSIAMNDDGVWSVGRVNQSGVPWGVMPFPKGKQEVTYGHYSPLSMLQSSKVKDATWTWMYWATLSEPGQTILVDNGQMQPMRKSLHQRFLDNPAPPDKKYKQVFIDELLSPNLRVTGDKVGAYWDSYKREWQQVTDPIYSQVFRGAKTMKDVSPTVKQKIETLLKTGNVS